MFLKPGLSLETYVAHPSFDLDLRQFEYASVPYLADLTQSALDARYRALRRNLLTLVTPERDTPPIESFLSSWFWLRKHVHIQAEYRRRGLPPPEVSPPFDTSLLEVQPPVRPESPFCYDFVVRYGERSWLNDMLVRGAVQLKPASAYNGEDMNEARRDDEMRQHQFRDGRRIRITGPDGAIQSPIGNARFTTEFTHGYYVLCTAGEYDPTLFDAFEADACLIIRDIDEFASRLEKAFEPYLGDRVFAHLPVQYQDVYSTDSYTPLGPGFSKDITYGFQREYRFAWSPSPAPGPLLILKADLGDLRDIAELHLWNRA